MHDLAIIGAGPAGMTALLYATLYGLDAICIGDHIGGKLNLAPDIHDYPGIPLIKGTAVIEGLSAQLKSVNQSVVVDEVVRIVNNQNHFVLTTRHGANLDAETILFATGNGNKQKENRVARLAIPLGVVVEKGLLVVDSGYMTGIQGIFACGDCVVYPYSLEQLVTAVSGGACAAATIYEYLEQTPPPIFWGKAQIKRI